MYVTLLAIITDESDQVVGWDSLLSAQPFSLNRPGGLLFAPAGVPYDL